MEMCWSPSACCFGIGLCCVLIVVNSTAKRYIRFEHVGGCAVGEHVHVFSRSFCQATGCLLRFVSGKPPPNKHWQAHFCSPPRTRSSLHPLYTIGSNQASTQQSTFFELPIHVCNVHVKRLFCLATVTTCNNLENHTPLQPTKAGKTCVAHYSTCRIFPAFFPPVAHRAPLRLLHQAVVSHRIESLSSWALDSEYPWDLDSSITLLFWDDKRRHRKVGSLQI